MASKCYQDGQSSKISELTQLAKKLISLTTFIDSKIKQMANHNELVEDLKFTKNSETFIRTRRLLCKLDCRYNQSRS